MVVTNTQRESVVGSHNALIITDAAVTQTSATEQKLADESGHLIEIYGSQTGKEGINKHFETRKKLSCSTTVSAKFQIYSP